MPRLIALTEPSREALRGDMRVIEGLPFKVGRECRLSPRNSDVGATPTNDLYICETGEVLHVSREHFLIDYDPTGGFILVDRNSLNGTIVEGRCVGGDRSGGEARLQDHSVIVVGGPTSPFIFKFRF
jgi:pSer/pThr/pTyr-binding forkhead associated (FHA) protein